MLITVSCCLPLVNCKPVEIGVWQYFCFLILLQNRYLQWSFSYALSQMEFLTLHHSRTHARMHFAKIFLYCVLLPLDWVTYYCMSDFPSNHVWNFHLAEFVYLVLVRQSSLPFQHFLPFLIQSMMVLQDYFIKESKHEAISQMIAQFTWGGLFCLAGDFRGVPCGVMSVHVTALCVFWVRRPNPLLCVIVFRKLLDILICETDTPCWDRVDVFALSVS